jgi:hypothetical protein
MNAVVKKINGEPQTVTKDDIARETDVTSAIPKSTDVKNLSADELIQKFSIDLETPLPPPPVALEIKGRSNNAPIGNYGGITLLTAKAKSGKTFAASILISALLSRKETQNKIIPHFQEGKDEFFFFDTEQSGFQTQKVGKRILALAGNQNKRKLHVLKLRSESNDKKEEIIEKIIYSRPKLAAIIIDGGRDLIFNINDPVESTTSTSKLLKWAEELYILIIVILHQNKNDNNARGHYGQDLKNKADVICNVTKDRESDTYLIEPEDCRDIEFEPFAFKIDEQGIPYIIDEYTPPGKAKKKEELLPHQVPDATHSQIIDEILSKLKPTYEDLVKAIVNEFGQMGVKMGDSKAKQFKTYWEQKGWIKKEKIKDLGRYPVYVRSQSV